jgi:hypothetical protein
MIVDTIGRTLRAAQSAEIRDGVRASRGDLVGYQKHGEEKFRFNDSTNYLFTKEYSHVLLPKFVES